MYHPALMPESIAEKRAYSVLVGKDDKLDEIVNCLEEVINMPLQLAIPLEHLLVHRNHLLGGE